MVKKSPAPFYAVAVLVLAWAWFFPLYDVTHYILAGGAAFLLFMVCKAVFPDKAFEVPDAGTEKKAEAPKAESPKEDPRPKPEKKSTGDPELDKIVKQKDLAISELRRLNDAIPDEKLSAQIDHLEDVTDKIIRHVVEHPQKKAQISRFLNFYLPTTLKLLNAYDRMDEAGVSGVNIDGTKGKIEAMMDTVVAAFDKQLDALFGDEALDISTDITVMENLLAQEGLGGTQLGI